MTQKAVALIAQSFHLILVPFAYDPETTPQVGELDELETFVGSKKIKSGFRQQ